jgi:hypothetical protein
MVPKESLAAAMPNETAGSRVQQEQQQEDVLSQKELQQHEEEKESQRLSGSISLQRQQAERRDGRQLQHDQYHHEQQQKQHPAYQQQHQQQHHPHQQQYLPHHHQKVASQAVQIVGSQAVQVVRDQAAERVGNQAVQMVQDQAVQMVENQAVQKVEDQAIQTVQEQAVRMEPNPAIQMVQNQAEQMVQNQAEQMVQGQALPSAGVEVRGGSRKLLVLSVGLAGVGKSSILRQVAKMLPGCSYLDKDVINQALLIGQPEGYFSEYYDKHVRRQTYEVMFGVAEDALRGGLCEVALLDGQFGDKLGESYIQEHLMAECTGSGKKAAAVPAAVAQVGSGGLSMGEETEGETLLGGGADKGVQHQQQQQQQGREPQQQAECCPPENDCWSVVVLVLECSAEEQLQRLKARGELRDQGKYACFQQYREEELRKQEQQLRQLPKEVVVIRVSTGARLRSDGHGVQASAEYVCEVLKGIR